MPATDILPLTGECRKRSLEQGDCLYALRHAFLVRGATRNNRRVRRGIRTGHVHSCNDCVGCLARADVDVEEKGPPLMQRCGHPMHAGCFVAHRNATAARHAADLFGPISFRAIKLHVFGAPCPMCRAENPLGHLHPFGIQDELWRVTWTFC